MADRFFLNACGVITPLGNGIEANLAAIQAGRRADYTAMPIAGGRQSLVAAIGTPLPEPPATPHDSRNNRVMLAALQQIATPIEAAIARWGSNRIGVVLGTSTSGMSDGETAFAHRLQHGTWQEFHYCRQELSSLAAFTAAILDLHGPAYVISTACSSGAKTFAAARRLIRAGIIDAAIVGGADTICQFTLGGFAAVEALASGPGNPFSRNRNGFNMGEGAACFLLSRESSAVELLGIGESTDAHHPTAPDPSGAGAQLAIETALAEARLAPDQIGYINLHGTGTLLNDAMESHAVSALFGGTVPASSTKAITGHMLGAAGACEAAFLWGLLNSADPAPLLPVHVWDGAADPELSPLDFVEPGRRASANIMLSTSFGFGGSNAALVLGRA